MDKRIGLVIAILFLICDLFTAQESIQTLNDFLRFRNVGPSRGGRVTAICGVNDLPETYYMGSTGGGLWKTENYGQSWQNISDGYFQTGSIGDIAVYQNDPRIVYVGTGSDGIRSNVITGRGMYKSMDSGQTWQHIGLINSGQTGAVVIHPQNPDMVFVGAIGQAFGPSEDRGVFRTSNGGKTWEKVLFLSDTLGCSDIELHPTDPNIIYAGMWRAERKPWTIISGSTEGGIYRSADGGDTWDKMKSGLPTGIVGKIDFAVSPQMPDRVWALIEASEKGGVYKSEDKGISWSLVSTKHALLDRPFYYCNIDVNPQNSNSLYVSATQFHHSMDGGITWQRISTPHGDNHGVWINPNDTMLWIQCNDGGANVTRDGGKTWSSQTNQNTAELYQVEIDDDFPYNLYAGQQDNSTIMVPSTPPYNSIAGYQGFWKAAGGCETGPAVPQPGNPNIVFSNCKGKFGVFNKSTGQEQQYYVGAANMYGHNPKDLKYRFQRVSPIHVSPHDAETIYHCSQYVHRTRDRGLTWETLSPDLTAFTPETQQISGYPITRDITGEEFYSTIYAIRESPLEPSVIWVGANDGPFHISKDNGNSWINITPPGLAPGGRVQQIEVSEHRPGKAYFAVYRYLLGDWKPYLYRTTDYGQTWTHLTNGSNGVPLDYPTRVVREDPTREGLLYAGTEFGLFVSWDDGASWHRLQGNLPVTPITDLKIKEGDLVLSTMGRSFWILDDLTPLRNWDWNNTTTLFVPRDAYRMSYRTYRGAASPEYLPPGAMIQYLITDTLASKLEFEISNDHGSIRTFQVPRSKNVKNTNSNLIDYAPKYSMGYHRFSWNMRHRGSRGPLVSPGIYTITMKLGNRSWKEHFEIKMDPRVVETGMEVSDLKQQELFSLQVSDLRNKTDTLIQDLAHFKNKIEATIWKKKKDQKLIPDVLKQINSLINQTKTKSGRYPTPMLRDQLSYLLGMVSRADQLPGNEALFRYSELKTWYDQVQKEFETVKNKITFPKEHKNQKRV